MRDVYLIALLAANAYFLFTVLANITYFQRATIRAAGTADAFVSVIVPARNEEANIRRCVESLLVQEYDDYEVIVVDDDSTDATAAIVAELASRDPRLRLVSAGPLPDGWLGKPWALFRGTATARGDVLLLTDADTSHNPRSISWAVTNLVGHDADFLSGYLEQEYGSFGEDIVVPTMYAAMLVVPFYLPSRASGSRTAFSIGQYVALRRAALDAVGGFAAVSDAITDDMSLAALLKEQGYAGVFLDAREAARCHLYRRYSDAFNGIKRSIYGAVGGHPVSAGIVIALVLGLIVGPAVWTAASYVVLGFPGPAAFAAVLFGLTWAIVLWDRRAPLLTAPLYPAVFFNLLLILIASMLSTGFGQGAEWKGRLVRLPRHLGRHREPQVVQK